MTVIVCHKSGDQRGQHFLRRNSGDIVQRWKAVKGAIEVQSAGPSGPWNVRVPTPKPSSRRPTMC